MMATTHVLAGILLALPVAMAYPSMTGPILVGVALGSVLPDLDLYYGHRRTLHYPTLGLVASPVAVAGAIAVPRPVTVAIAFVVLGATLHARMDEFGGGLELRPWLATSERAVYDHVRDTWRPPRRFVRYDGAPEDVALAGVLAAPGLLVLEGHWWWVIVGALAVSVVYGLLRKHVVDVGLVLLRRLPEVVLLVLPVRYLEEEAATADGAPAREGAHHAGD